MHNKCGLLTLLLFTGQNKSHQYLFCKERLPQPGLQRLSAAISHTVPVQLAALHAAYIQPSAAVSLRHRPSHLDSISNSILRDSSGETFIKQLIKKKIFWRMIVDWHAFLFHRHLFLTAGLSMDLARLHTTKLVQILSTLDALSTETGSFISFIEAYSML